VGVLSWLGKQNYHSNPPWRQTQPRWPKNEQHARAKFRKLSRPKTIREHKESHTEIIILSVQTTSAASICKYIITFPIQQFQQLFSIRHSPTMYNYYYWYKGIWSTITGQDPDTLNRERCNAIALNSRPTPPRLRKARGGGQTLLLGPAGHGRPFLIRR
jgi:hypothetical protein